MPKQEDVPTVKTVQSITIEIRTYTIRKGDKFKTLQDTRKATFSNMVDVKRFIDGFNL